MNSTSVRELELFRGHEFDHPHSLLKVTIIENCSKPLETNGTQKIGIQIWNPDVSHHLRVCKINCVPFDCEKVLIPLFGSGFK